MTLRTAGSPPWPGLAVALILAGLSLPLLSIEALATRLQHLNTRELTRGSHQIVIGRVEQVRSRWNERHTKIVTDVTIRVSESIKGETSGQITLTQFGGEVDSLRVSVPGGPLFVPGEEALLFVWRDPNGSAQVTGLGQGKFEITIEKTTGRKLIQRRVPGLEIREVRMLRSGPRGAAGQGMPLEDLVTEIRAAMAEGDR